MTPEMRECIRLFQEAQALYNRIVQERITLAQDVKVPHA